MVASPFPLRNSSGKVTWREIVPAPGVLLLLCKINEKRENPPEQQTPAQIITTEFARNPTAHHHFFILLAIQTLL